MAAGFRVKEETTGHVLDLIEFLFLHSAAKAGTFLTQITVVSFCFPFGHFPCLIDFLSSVWVPKGLLRLGEVSSDPAGVPQHSKNTKITSELSMEGEGICF